MAKAIHCLKIFLSQSQFSLKQKKNIYSQSTCLHYSTIRKSLVCCTSDFMCTYQELNYLKDLIRYQYIDKCISEIMIKKKYDYVWFRSPQADALSFFDPHVLVDIKRKILRWIQKKISRCVLIPKESIEILNKGLENFVCVSSMQFFIHFKINNDFFYD